MDSVKIECEFWCSREAICSWSIHFPETHWVCHTLHTTFSLSSLSIRSLEFAPLKDGHHWPRQRFGTYAAKTLDFLAENSVQLVSHLAYSPDLSPCDFFLFPVKERIRGIRFDSPVEARVAFQEAVWTLPGDRGHNCFDSWIHRMKLCIESSSWNFEKLWKSD